MLGRRCLDFAASLLLVSTVETSASETLLIPVPVRTIYAGEIVNNADLTMKLFSVSETSRKTYATEVDQFSRMEAARVLIAGKPVSLRSLRNMEDVKKGQMVKAVYLNGVIEIQTTLLPLSNGSIGDIIEARNAGSGNTVRAQIASDGSLIVIGK
jgi:flagellar basal body P-ring formation protein FlgA